MNVAFYSGVSGMIAFQQDLDVQAHNMANVSTVGYKPTRSAFTDLLYTQMNTNEEHQAGHGTKIYGTDLLYKQGIMRTSESPLDFGLVGDGFFAVDRGGDIEYTRNGAFTISLEGKRGYLCTTDGGYVLDSKGKQIRLEQDTDTGAYNYSALPDKIGVYSFDNPYGLLQTDGSSFRPTDLSGDAVALNNGKKNQVLPYDLVQYSLESSGVDLADEMVNVMVTQRAFQFSAKMVQTSDQVEEIVNNLR